MNGCYEHAGRTCCSNPDTTKIRLKYENSRLKQDPESVSRECMSAVNDALCYLCDGDFVSTFFEINVKGTGTSDGLCLGYCSHLYDLCKDSFIDQSLNPDDTLPFCRSDSMICSKVSSLVDSPVDFCKVLGLPISTRQISITQEKKIGLMKPDEEKDCFSGQSAVGVKYSRLSRRPPPEPTPDR